MDFVSALSAGGSFLSGLGSLGIGGGEKRPRYRDALRAQKIATMNDFDARLESAKKHGIHPLVALGVQPTAPVQGTVGSASVDLEAAGQNVSRAAAAIQSGEERKIQGILNRQQVERGQLENELLKSDIALKRSQLAPGLASYRGGAMTGVKAALADLPTPLGSRDGVLPIHKTAYDENLQPVRVFNEQDLGDNDVLQLIHALRYTLPDYFHNYVAKPFKNFRSRYRQRSGVGRGFLGSQR